METLLDRRVRKDCEPSSYQVKIELLLKILSYFSLKLRPSNGFQWVLIAATTIEI